MCIQGCTEADPVLLNLLTEAREKETNPIAQEILGELRTNAYLAEETGVPLCQDTGVAVFFVDRGEKVAMRGGGLEESIQQGVREGYRAGYLRKSMVKDPLNRENTGDNTPAIIHTRLVPGNKLRIRYTAKGAGSENMSRIAMLKPTEGVEGVKDCIVAAVAEGGGNTCPPIIVGVGIGGDFEKCALLAKESLFRKLGAPSDNPFYAALEKELLERINELGIGPMGLGGRTTALAVHILAHPCHIASLPVAVNINCHSSRHEEVVL
jgi:fumarate hydratase subunit alpha